LVALVAPLLAACQRDRASGGAESTAIAATPAPAVPAAAKGPCPATGAWAVCSVVERLTRAGLGTRLDSLSATEPPLSPPGALVHLGASQLELYIYPDTAARAREQAKLDRAKYLDYATPQNMRQQPTLIISANLIAILQSRNDHQRERVADAITAGPPQPSRP
jgi:hypothetical protein